MQASMLRQAFEVETAPTLGFSISEAIAVSPTKKQAKPRGEVTRISRDGSTTCRRLSDGTVRGTEVQVLRLSFAGAAVVDISYQNHIHALAAKHLDISATFSKQKVAGLKSVYNEVN